MDNVLLNSFTSALTSPIFGIFQRNQRIANFIIDRNRLLLRRVRRVSLTRFFTQLRRNFMGNLNLININCRQVAC